MALFGRWTKGAGADSLPPEADEIDVQVVRTGSQATVTVIGRVTIDSSPYLRSVLLALVRREAGMVITIDLSRVSYMDTSGIATLLEVLKAAQDRSVTLRLDGVGGEVRMLVEITELAEIFRASGSEVAFS